MKKASLNRRDTARKLRTPLFLITILVGSEFFVNKQLNLLAFFIV